MQVATYCFTICLNLHLRSAKREAVSAVECVNILSKIWIGRMEGGIQPNFIPILSDSAFTRSADGQEYTRHLANRKPYLLSIATCEFNAKNFTHRYKIRTYAPRHAKTPAGNRCIEQVGLKVRKGIAIGTSKKGLLNEIVVQIAVVKPTHLPPT